MAKLYVVRKWMQVGASDMGPNGYATGIPTWTWQELRRVKTKERAIQLAKELEGPERTFGVVSAENRKKNGCTQVIEEDDDD